MTVILDQLWQDAHTSRKSAHMFSQRKKPLLRVSPDYNNNQTNDTEPDTHLSPIARDPGLLSPNTSKSPRSGSISKKMHFRIRSLSGARSPATPRQRWERLSDSEKERSELFFKDAVSMCGLAGYSWKKTYEYLQLAAELPLDPQYLADADDVPPPTPSESTSRLASLLDKKSSANSLLTPDSASARSGSSRPDTSASSITSASSLPEPDLKLVLPDIRKAFESMQNSRDPAYTRYINMPGNNLKKMHAHAVAAHREATLKKERSSLMDAIDFDKRADKARDMELSIAKLRFEMELAVPNTDVDELGRDSKSTQSLSSRPTQVSAKSNSTSRSVPPSSRRPFDTSDMRRDASQNNRISGVPTVITTTSDMSHLRHLSIASSIDRPESQASAKSDGHVHSKDTWRRLQDAKARLSGRRKFDGVGQPGVAQKIDENGFFSARPAGPKSAS